VWSFVLFENNAISTLCLYFDNLDIYCILFQMSTNRACPAVVYSCLIRNNSDAEVDVQIEFAGIEDHHAEIADIEIAQGEEQRIDEKEFEHGESNGKYHKTIELVRVRKYDGSTIELKKPFAGVTSPKKDWIFEIYNDSIKSIDPNKK
jgi:hypothetical protein